MHIPIHTFHQLVYFDQFAFEKFIEKDIMLCGVALNDTVNSDICFKFLKYGTGFFTGEPSIKYCIYDIFSSAGASGLDKMLLLVPKIKRSCFRFIMNRLS